MRPKSKKEAFWKKPTMKEQQKSVWTFSSKLLSTTVMTKMTRKLWKGRCTCWRKLWYSGPIQRRNLRTLKEWSTGRRIPIYKARILLSASSTLSSTSSIFFSCTKLIRNFSPSSPPSSNWFRWDRWLLPGLEQTQQWIQLVLSSQSATSTSWICFVLSWKDC